MACVNALSGLSCYVQAPKFSATWAMFQCPHELELLPTGIYILEMVQLFQCPHGLELLPDFHNLNLDWVLVSMPSWA